MNDSPGSRPAAVVIALCVVFLWATSWVLIKFGLEEIPALTFADLRYTLAIVFLLPVAGIVVQGLPAISATGWAIIVWLTLVNTALAFTLWYHTLRTLSATDR